MFKDFEDWWENSGIKDTDSYRCIAETYQFNKENIPQAFKSFARNCFSYGHSEGFDIGRRYGRGDMTETMLAFFDMLKIADDIKIVREMIDVMSKTYHKRIEDDKFGFPVEKEIS